MFIIPPRSVGDSELISTNIPFQYPTENVLEYDNTATYSQGDEVYLLSTKRIYECVIAVGDTVTGVSPETDTEKWMERDPLNQWAPFDKRLGTYSKGGEDFTWNGDIKQGIYFEVNLSDVVDSLSFFGILGKKLYVKVTDPVEGVVYETEVDLVDQEGIYDWLTYFFDPIDYRVEYNLYDLPLYGNTTISIAIEKFDGQDVAQLSQVVLGRREDIGCTRFGLRFGIEDFSRKGRDSFGRPLLIERPFNKNAAFDVNLDNSRIDRVARLLQRYRAEPVVWVILDEFESTTIYGNYRDFSIILPNINISTCQIEIQGLDQ